MFKKSLIASAIAVLSFNAAAAVTVTLSEVGGNTISKDPVTGAQLVSLEGLPVSKRFDVAKATNGSTNADLTVDVTFGATEIASLADSDNVAKVKLTISGAALSASPTAANVVISDAAPAGDGNGTDEAAPLTPAIATSPAPNSTSFVVELTKDTLDQTGEGANGDNSWEAVFADEGALQFINLPVIFADAAKGSSVNVVAELLTSTGVSLGKSAVKPVATLTNQFSVKTKDTTGKLNADIDVAQERKYFADATKQAKDVLTLDFGNIGGDADPTEAVVTLYGDFNGLKSVTDGSGNKYVVNATKTEAMFEFDAATTPSVTTLIQGAGDYEVTFEVDGETTLTERGFSFSVDLEYDDGENASRDLKLANKATAGSWNLNGDSAYISFLPFGPAYSQSVTVTNKGKVEGEISVDWFFNGTVKTTKLTAKAKPEAVTDISSELRSIAAANGIVGNAALNIVINSPDGQITVDALYYSKADKDRGVVAAGL